MQYTHYDIGDQRAGATVRVSLQGSAANVMLVDSTALSQYRRGGRYTYYGGQATRSPVVLRVPRRAHWHVVIDLGGSRGSVQSAVEVVP